MSFALDEHSDPVPAGSAGGLAATLEPLLEGTAAKWVACAMSEADRKAADRGLMEIEDIELVTVQPDPDTYRMAYDVVSNSTLWFCHHHLFDLSRRPRFDRHWAEAWDGYRRLNEAFASAIAVAASHGATVLVQDYHLCLVPGMLAATRSDLRCIHFTHTPFADPSFLRVLPSQAAKELLESMGAARACGFHTSRWEAAFLACCSDQGTRAPPTFVAPLAPDPGLLAARASSPESEAAGKRLRALVGDRRVVLSVDRVEPSKNLLRGYWAFDELLRRYPEHRDSVVFLSLSYLSRQALPEYAAYSTEVEHAARRLNDLWGTPERSPVVLDIADDPARSIAALTMYDILLVNPIRDGLNLVAKEGPLLNGEDGVLALSREAGAYEELASHVLELNPFDVSATAETLDLALRMPAQERKRRAEALRSAITARPPRSWIDFQLALARDS